MVVSSLYCITYIISYIFFLIPDLCIHTYNFLSSMPNRCSVANCSNYDGTDYVPMFQMLNHWSKEMQDKWRRFLYSRGFQPFAPYSYRFGNTRDPHNNNVNFLLELILNMTYILVHNYE